MRYNLLFAAILLFILVLPLAAALSTTYETSSVSRIVGNSPKEMKQQLVSGEFKPASAAYLSSNSGLGNYRKFVIQNQFSTSTIQTGGWSNTNVLGALTSTGSNYLTLEAGQDAGYNANPQISLSDVSGWKSALAGKQNVIVLDSKYAGVAIPQYSSFATRLSPDAAVVAPVSYSNREFVRSFICNMAKNQDKYALGEIFRQARNNYRWGVQKFDELIGLTLLSYNLFGVPTTKTTTPFLGSGSLGTYCSEYSKIYSINSAEDYKITASDEGYIKQYTTVISGYDIEQEENYSVLSVAGTRFSMVPGEPILPLFVRTVEFPLQTIIDEVNLTSFEDPVNITLSNLPSFDGFEITGRMCYKDVFEPKFTFDETFSETSHMVILRVIPVKIEDCTTGKAQLYQKFSYEIKYIPDSPVLITSVDVPEQQVPDALTTVVINIENTQSTPVDGVLTIKKDGEIQSSKNITTTQSQYSLDLITPSMDGKYAYRAEFSQNGQIKAVEEFTINVQYLSFKLAVPSNLINADTAQLGITNIWNNNLEVTINYKITDGGTILHSGALTATLSPGEQTIQLPLPALTRRSEPYTFIVEATYLDRTETLTTSLSTNAAPVITLETGKIAEGQPIQIEVMVTDPDDDPVVTKISKPFPIDGTFTPNYEQSGDYKLSIQADDGYTALNQEIGFAIQNTNRPPVIPELFEGSEGDLFEITNITDPDNENCVDNDDNNLTIIYGAPLDENGMFVPGYDSPRELNVSVTVSDGELSVTEMATIRIANTNRPPRIALPDTIASDYEIDLAPYVNISDPDNENTDPSDDNQLSIIYAPPFDSSGHWTPPQPGLVFTTVKVTDGEFIVGKDVWINVSATHPMPQPPYTFPEYNNTPAPAENLTLPENITNPANLTPEINQSTQQNQTVNETATQNETSTPAPATTPATTTNGLEIEITAKADGRTKKVNGDTSLSVEPDSEVKLKISLKNKGNTTKKITVEAGIDELDEEEKETVTLKPDDDDELKYEFFIPRLTDEDKYKLEITVRENSFRQKWVLTLKLDKPSHELSIRRAKAEACDDNGRITIRLENTGSSEEKGTLRLESKSLGLDRKIQFALDEGEYKTFSEPFLVEKGTHTISVTAEYNRRSITKEVPVENC